MSYIPAKVNQAMHHHRRRKKRPSYGVRTVEITRGKNGFGFTISGQAPCILSCIITGSPAEKAGLRPGDFLIAVNSQNVSKALHDDVVRLIGNSSGILKLQIAENYYSDSSEEEFVSVVKLKPKYSHKVRHRLVQNSVSRAEKVVQDLQTGALFVDHIHGAEVKPEPVENKSCTNMFDLRQSNKALWDLILQKHLANNNRPNLNSQNISNSSTTKAKHSLNPQKKSTDPGKIRNHAANSNASGGLTDAVFHSIFTEQDLNNILYPAIFLEHQNKDVAENAEHAILKVVVGYLGTIEMPKEPQVPNSRLQTIRNCIRRLRIEKKVHSLVLMTVFPESIILINPQGLTLAEFAAEKLTFSGVYSDDKKFFGLVTNHETNNPKVNCEKEPIFLSSSCHIFMVDPKLTPHHQHIKRAKAFHIACTPDPVTSKCKEFPESAETILQAVVGLYRSRVGLNIESGHEPESHENISPPPSNTSSNSSNSDSGIGFRDEGNTSDRVLIVDADICNQYSTNGLERQVLITPGFAAHETPLCAFSLPAVKSPSPNAMSQTLTSESGQAASNSLNCSSFNRLTVRAMPDPVGFQNSTEHLDTQTDLNDLAISMVRYQQLEKDSMLYKNGRKIYRSSSLESIEKSYQVSQVMQKNFRSPKSLKVHKLSPKVYDLYFPLQNASNSSVSADSVSWKSGVCCPDELNSFEREIALNEKCDTTKIRNKHQHTKLSMPVDDDSESDNFEIGRQYEIHNEWTRTSSLRRHIGYKRNFNHTTHEAGFVSDGELAMEKVSTSSSLFAHEHMSDSSCRSSFTSEKHADISHTASLASDFSVVLDDPVGLHLFREFLKKEFSEENITFWVACEQYRQLIDKGEMIKMAHEIYSRHLSIGAHEPVNVDSHARQIAQEGLDCPSPDLFMPAQKQIFNLMKFDCYQRFLKSSIFKDNMLSRIQANSLIYKNEEHDGDQKIKKSILEKKKRKPLIPWLSKTKSKEPKCHTAKLWGRHGEIRKSLKKKNKSDLMKLGYASSTQSDVTSSRSSLTGSETGILCKNISSRESLNSEDLALIPRCQGSNEYYCRVILPDCSTTVVRTQKNETVGQMLLKLLERRCLSYNAVEAYLIGSDQPLDHSIGVRKLSCNEIRVEQVILFCLELPNKKTIGVKAKSGKMCGEILKPVLQKYGYKIDSVLLIIASTQKQVPQDAPIRQIDNQRINVILKSFLTPSTGLDTEKGENTSHVFPDFEALTNQIFEDLLNNQLEFPLDGFGIDIRDTVDNNENNFCIPTHAELPESKKYRDRQKKSSHKSHASRSSSLNKAPSQHNVRKRLCNLSDEWKPPASKESIGPDLTVDGSVKDFSIGKENCSVTANVRGEKFDKTGIPFNDNAYSCLEKKFPMTSCLLGLTQDSKTDNIYSTSEQAEQYFSNDHCPSYVLEDPEDKNQIISNGNSSSTDDLKTTTNSSHLDDMMPDSNLLPKATNCIIPLSHPERPSSTALQSSFLSADVDPFDNDNHNLDASTDVTLTGQSDNSFLQGETDSIDDVDKTLLCAEYVPFSLSSSLDQNNVKEAYEPDCELHYPVPPVRKMPEPPPVPPKALSRGPPPRPPNRQLMDMNSRSCFLFDEDASDQNIESIGTTERSLGKTKVIPGDFKDFNISFV